MTDAHQIRKITGNLHSMWVMSRDNAERQR